MGKRRYTREDYEKALKIYETWDHTDPAGSSLERLLADAGLMSKQSFFMWMRNEGIPTKSRGLRRPARLDKVASEQTPEMAGALLALWECTARVRDLEAFIREQGLPVP